MGYIDNITVQRILDTADIVEVVGEFVSLRRSGSNYMGLCPFHNERSPSFSVSKSKGICKCFSCGKGGNVVHFLMELNQWSYGEALRWLAAKYGIEIKEKELTDDERRREKERETLISAMSFAAEHYAVNLEKSSEAVAIAETLGTSVRALKALGAGLAWNASLSSDAAAKGFSEKILQQCGLDADKAYATLDSGAIVLPIASRYNKVFGLGYIPISRDNAGEVHEKIRYVGPQQLFNINDQFAGFQFARKGISKRQRAVVCLSPAELLPLSAAGVDNCIALLSPGFSEQRVATLRRLAPEIVIILPPRLYWDGYRYLDSTLPLIRAGINVRIAEIPTGISVERFAAGCDSESIEAALGENSRDIVSFKLSQLKDIRNKNSGRKLTDIEQYLMNDLQRTIAAVADPILRDVYISAAAPELRVSEVALKRMLDAGK